MNLAESRKRVEIRGVVQGVGFRPFVYRTARTFDIRGYVLNSSAGVVIEAEGWEPAVLQFIRTIQTELPPLARIDEITIADVKPCGEAGFLIRPSAAIAEEFALVPPDVATCDWCRRDVITPGDRRHGYPFTNCTNCGPRYTIIRDLPYDRPKTTMEEFQMCELCRNEYEDPINRRFHAEPNACPECGPRLALLSNDELARGIQPTFSPPRDSHDSLELARQLLARGEIVAIKGLGGFHLACNAFNERAVGLLRERKRRSRKAFAIMARDLKTVERLCEPTDADRELLLSARRPIVLMRRRDPAAIPADVAPGSATLGVMLPYTPLHQLLFEDSPGFDVLVMTSGNLSEEPIVSSNEEAWPRLHALADHFLLHNRKIQTCVDDSVVQTFEHREYPIRRSRGYAPEPIDLGTPVRQILSCGGELKNTFCLTKDHYAIVSQHIGDLENLETMDFFRETLSHLKRFFRVSPEAVAYDLHPNYLSSRFALEESGLRPIGVQHHHAHIVSCMADNGLRGRVIGVAFDGTGYGTDGQIWGGEFLVCGLGEYERRAHLAYVPLAGGDRAIRQPWRSALAYLRAAFGAETMSLALSLFGDIPQTQLVVVDAMIGRGIQTIQTSSCGRLFDAVASIVGLRHEIAYEGQAAIELEMAASETMQGYPFQFSGCEPCQVDMRPTIEAIVRDLGRGVTVAEISGRFHHTMAQVVVNGCESVRDSDGLNRVCLSGGTFQNLLLLKYAVSGLRQRGFDVFVHHQVPPNDGGLSLGQAVIANELLTR